MSAVRNLQGPNGGVWTEDTTRTQLVSGNQLSVGAGTGITTGTGTVYFNSIEQAGPVIRTTIFIDLTGLNSGASADIIGVDGGTANCHIGQVNFGEMGTLFAINMTCLELPAGGDPNIDLYAADEATGAEDTAITALTNDIALIASSGDWIATGALTTQSASALPADQQYLYLVDGAGTSDTYTAGKFKIELIGYDTV